MKYLTILGSILLSIWAATAPASAQADAQLLAANGNFGQGVIIGSLVLSGLFLLIVAAVLRSAVAFCGFLLLATSAAVVAPSLGLIGPLSASVSGAVLSGFVAAALIFVSSLLGVSRERPIIGSSLFAAALVLVGTGLINIVVGGQAAGLLQKATWGGGLLLVGLVMAEAMRGDGAARAIAPGAAFAFAAPLIASTVGAAAILVGGIFVFGVTTTALFGSAYQLAGVASRRQSSIVAPLSGDAAAFAYTGENDRRAASKVAPTAPSGDDQLAQVLDYSGIAMWDWSPNAVRQSASFGGLFGEGDGGQFSPQQISDRVHADDAARFAAEIYGEVAMDGSFDERIQLASGTFLRLRGARAVTANGDLERVIVFAELAKTAAEADDNLLKAAAASLTGAAAAGDIRRDTGGVSPELVSAALDNGEINARFQPIVDMASKKVVGFETLLRWPDAPKGLNITAPDIVRAATIAGKGLELSRIVIFKAASLIQEKSKAKSGRPFVAFNVAVSQLTEAGFHDVVKDAIETHKLAKKSLVVEITETERFADSRELLPALNALKALGVGFAVDDFGAGFTSYSTLGAFEFDYLKIDKAFTESAVKDATAAKIMRSLAGLGGDLGLKVIAEGIESPEAAKKALNAGCTLGQGFHFGEPIDVPDEAIMVEEVEADTASSGRSSNPSTIDDTTISKKEPEDEATQAEANSQTSERVEPADANADAAASDAETTAALAPNNSIEEKKYAERAANPEGGKDVGKKRLGAAAFFSSKKKKAKTKSRAEDGEGAAAEAEAVAEGDMIDADAAAETAVEHSAEAGIGDTSQGQKIALDDHVETVKPFGRAARIRMRRAGML